MTDSNNALAALGLDLAGDPLVGDVSKASKAEGVAPEASSASTTALAAEAHAEAPAREEVEIGDIEFGEITDIPAQRRVGGERGSKYPFHDLAAPAKREDGKTAYANFVVKYVEGTDETKFKRSVQSATTQRNRAAKEAKEPNYYITRAVSKDGKFVGMQVIRTDVRPEKEEDEAS